MAGELTGTRRAYDRCGGCGHARQRHLAGGTAACVQVVMQLVARDLRPADQVPTQCDCPAFIEPRERS